MKIYRLINLFLLFAAGYTSQCQEAKIAPRGHFPSAIIYKTRVDYSKYVPVTLSEDGSRVVSYPAPQDVFYQGRLAIPSRLAKGYWLDNRGIGVNSCFIKLTYEEYSKLPQAPSPEDLFKLIIDKKPFRQMYDLGPRNKFQDEINDINNIILHHLRQYQRML